MQPLFMAKATITCGLLAVPVLSPSAVAGGWRVLSGHAGRPLSAQPIRQRSFAPNDKPLAPPGPEALRCDLCVGEAGRIVGPIQLFPAIYEETCIRAVQAARQIDSSIPEMQPTFTLGNLCTRVGH